LNELREDDRWLRSTTAHGGKVKNLVEAVLADDGRGACEHACL